MQRQLQPYKESAAKPNPWLAPIRIPLGRSRIGHLVEYTCWSVILVVPWLLSIQALPWVTLFLAGILLQKRLRRNPSLAAKAAILRTDDLWELLLGDGQRIAAYAGSTPLAHPWITVVKLHSNIGSCSVVVWPDSLSHAQRRRLRARVMLGGRPSGTESLL